MSTFTHLLAAAPVVLDGGLGTLLDARGHDVAGPLWSARVLREQPEAIEAAHDEFFEAGAMVATSASYQVSRDGFRRAGLSETEADTALDTSVRLARAAADRAGDGRVVAASVGPFGATRADGSEYHGAYGLTVDELAAWHRPRIEALWAAGPDVLAIETIPSLAEAEAIARALEGTGAVAWLSYTVAGGQTRAGESLGDAFAIADATPEIVATGVNCCAPIEVSVALRALRSRSDKPAVVYPNSGEEWDAKNRRWMGSPALPPELVDEWVHEGASAIGGCCRVGPEHIALIGDAVGRSRH
ncbi:homocysteine S-methyltransferase [Labedella endophytica]|uniref:Homocysteine S-methyltransferase n=1 Tax=Labedella endophytica TaxID=1523160 RepID=A0A3S0VB05_9MICO|nr:homocysteine S-methyltransferase [Labedella endophytica]RUR01125.1 homocysteine S-methyltransferase [Labedella endophytica]